MNAPFELVAGHPALDFVNTLDRRFREEGPEDLLETYGDLLRFCEQCKISEPRSRNPATGERILGQCRELREALAAIFYAQLDGRRPWAATLKTIDGYFKAARQQQKLCRNGSQFEWVLAIPNNDPALPLWALALSASDLMTSAALDRVRACDSPECRWLFLDTSKNHTRRWCDMKLCGNRMKARRFKAQHKG